MIYVDYSVETCLIANLFLKLSIVFVHIYKPSASEEKSPFISFIHVRLQKLSMAPG